MPDTTSGPGLTDQERRDLRCHCTRNDSGWHHVRFCPVPVVERILAARGVSVQADTCRHCGKLPEADGDHSCPCPYRDDDCPDHPLVTSPITASTWPEDEPLGSPPPWPSAALAASPAPTEDDLEYPECDDHKEVQHRDRQPPWCNKCGWNRGRPATAPFKGKKD